MSQMRTEGVQFHTHINIGVDLPVAKLRAEYDAVVLAGGSEKPRDFDIPGRSFDGIYFAMEFLNRKQQAGARLPCPR